MGHGRESLSSFFSMLFSNFFFIVRGDPLNVLSGVVLGQEKGWFLANSMHLVSQIVYC